MRKVDYDGNLGGIDFSTTFQWEDGEWAVAEVRVARLNTTTKQIKWEIISFDDWEYNGEALQDKLYELHESALDELSAEGEEDEDE